MLSLCYFKKPSGKEGSPWSAVVKNLPAAQETGFSPWVGKIPWKREWQPTPALLPGECYGQRSLAATVHGVTKSQTGLKYLASMRTPWGRVIVLILLMRKQTREAWSLTQRCMASHRAGGEVSACSLTPVAEARILRAAAVEGRGAVSLSRAGSPGGHFLWLAQDFIFFLF